MAGAMAFRRRLATGLALFGVACIALALVAVLAARIPDAARTLPTDAPSAPLLAAAAFAGNSPRSLEKRVDNAGMEPEEALICGRDGFCPPDGFAECVDPDTGGPCGCEAGTSYNAFALNREGQCTCSQICMLKAFVKVAAAHDVLYGGMSRGLCTEQPTMKNCKVTSVGRRTGVRYFVYTCDSAFEPNDPGHNELTAAGLKDPISGSCAAPTPAGEGGAGKPPKRVHVTRTAIAHNRTNVPHNRATVQHNRTTVPHNRTTVQHNHTIVQHNRTTSLHNRTIASHDTSRPPHTSSRQNNASRLHDVSRQSSRQNNVSRALHNRSSHWAGNADAGFDLDCSRDEKATSGKSCDELRAMVEMGRSTLSSAEQREELRVKRLAYAKSPKSAEPPKSRPETEGPVTKSRLLDSWRARRSEISQRRSGDVGPTPVPTPFPIPIPTPDPIPNLTRASATPASAWRRRRGNTMASPSPRAPPPSSPSPPAPPPCVDELGAEHCHAHKQLCSRARVFRGCESTCGRC